MGWEFTHINMLANFEMVSLKQFLKNGSLKHFLRRPFSFEIPHFLYIVILITMTQLSIVRLSVAVEVRFSIVAIIYRKPSNRSMFL